MASASGLTQQETIRRLAEVNDLAAAVVNKTRPGDTTAYAVGDAIDLASPTGWVFTGLGRASGLGIVVVRAELLTDQAANVAAYRLHLFNAAPTYIADNAAYIPTLASLVNRIGYIDFPAAASHGTSLAASQVSGDVVLAGAVASGANALYGILEARTIFTPANAQNFRITLTARQVS
jgi:hypothetical protein